MLLYTHFFLGFESLTEEMDDLKEGKKLREGKMEGREKEEKEEKKKEMHGFQSSLRCVMEGLRSMRLPSGNTGKGEQQP